jgi:transposase
VILTAADEDTALAVDVLPGQAHDAPHLEPLLAATRARFPAVDEVVADKGFDGEPQRQACRRRGVAPQIPSRCNAREPQPLDAAAYRERNRVERLFAKLKQFRRVATRYEKLKDTFRGAVLLAQSFIRLRKLAVVNTT